MFTKYAEKSLVVLPISPKSKVPVKDASGFDQWAINGQPEELIEQWESKYSIEKGYGLAVLFGPHTDICCVDVDTLIPEIVKSIPNSPVLRRGSPYRYGALFFRKGEGVDRNFSFKRTLKDGSREGIDILVDRKYLVVPPSIHPDTLQAYTWAYDSLLDVELDDLPILTLEDIQRMADAVGTETVGLVKVNSGRNNKLVEMASAMRFKLKNEDEIVRELYEYDLTHHKPRLFTDQSEGFKAKTEEEALANAWLFLSNVTRSLIKSKKLQIQPAIEVIENPIIEEKTKLKELPSIPKDSIMRVFYEDVMNHSLFPQHKYAVASSLMLMSTLACGRYEMKGKTPTLYSLIVGDTGIGKDRCKQFIYDVLTHEEIRRFNLLGIGNYSSVASLISNIQVQRSRIDVLDEITSFLKECSYPNSYKRAVALELTKLYSIGSGYYAGNRALSRKKEECGECWSPMINLMGLCQPKTLISSATSDMIESGFLSRILIFYEDQRAELNKAFYDCKTSVKNSVDVINTFFGNKVNIFGMQSSISSIELNMANMRPNATEVKMSAEASSAVLDMIEHYSALSADDSKTDVERAILSRSVEHMERIALVLAVSRGACVIEPKDLDWSKELVDALGSNALAITKQAGARSETERISEAIVQFIRERGSVDKRDLWSKFRSIKKYDRNAIIDDMVESNIIKKTKGIGGVSFSLI